MRQKIILLGFIIVTALLTVGCKDISLLSNRPPKAGENAKWICKECDLFFYSGNVEIEDIIWVKPGFIKNKEGLLQEIHFSTPCINAPQEMYVRFELKGYTPKAEYSDSRFFHLKCKYKNGYFIAYPDERSKEKLKEITGRDYTKLTFVKVDMIENNTK